MSLAAPGTNPASNLELKLPHTIGSANQLLKVDGSGQLGWATDNSGLTLSNDANNRIVTGTGSGLNAEANLTFDGSLLELDQGTSGGNSFKILNDEISLLTGVNGTGDTYAREAFFGTTRVDSGSLPLLRIAGQGGIKFCVDANSERVRIDSSGEVLIGATARGREKGLHLAGANQDPTGVWTQMGIYSTDSQAAGKGGSIGFGGQDGSLAKQQFAAIKGAKENGTSGNYAGYMSFYTRPNGAVTQERLRIKSDGSIRVDGPTAATHGLRFTPNGWNGYDNRMGYCGTSGADFWWSSNWNPTDGSRDHSGYATNYIRQNISSGYLSFGTGAVNTSASERLRITSAGDVGINTNSPVRKLEVNGTARVSGAFEAYPSSTSAISAGTFYNNSTGASADCRVQIKTYANQGADPYLHFDAGGSNFICGMKYEGTTNNKLVIGAGDSPSTGILGGLYIHGGGNLSINNSSNPSRRLAIYDTSQVQYYSYGKSTSHFNQQYQSNQNSGTQYYNVFTRLDGSWDGYLVSSTDGQITLANNSDYRLKENVVSMTNGIDIIKKLNPITYKWKASTGRDTSVTMQGFFAHEVDEAGVLGAVDGVKDGVWETAENPEDAAIGDPRIQGLSLERLVPALTAALKEAITKIETLETKVAALEAG